jgi:hypothetical protein
LLFIIIIIIITQLKIGDKIIKEPHCIVEALTDHFYSIFNSPSSVVIPGNSHFTLSDF